MIYLLTRSLFRVGFEWRRLAQLVAILGGVAVSGELLLPTTARSGCSRGSPGTRSSRRFSC